MTARLNQDALERFFSLARGVCGSNDHPDSILFGQMFRLISTYSLIKPCAGSNVSGSEIFNALLKFNNISHTSNGREEWQTIIDSVIENGRLDEITNSTYLTDINEDVGLPGTSRYLMAYMSGYVARKCRKWTTCVDCIEDLQTTQSDQEHHKMISLMTQGHLIYPSNRLVQLLGMIEETILNIVKKESVNCDMLFQITYALQELSLPLIGCCEHKMQLTKSVTSFYIIIRAEFLAKSYNKMNYQAKQKTRKARKDAKL